MANVSIRTTSFAVDAELIYSLRKTVFIDEQGVPADIEIDEFDPVCQHVLAWRDDVAVGTGRIAPDGRIGRMAVIAEYRGQGIGRAILAALMQLGRDTSVDRLYLSAQCQAISFYEQAGFVASGPVYDDAGIDHRHMALPSATDGSDGGLG
ncbi:MAG: GNAT family N-acetyltransferase [Gammaproteobacteria bacterium]|nr:GNAT family N-acetyltransferase [Gammaproteobacteria bacterium]